MAGSVNLRDAYRAARASAAASATAPAPPAGLVAIYDELARRLALVQQRYDAGRVSAESFGKQAAAFSSLAADKARLLGEEMGRQEAAARKLAAEVQALGNAFQASSNFVTGWVRAGLAGTTEGNHLALQFQQLSREVSALFLPVIYKVIGAVQSVTDWFRSLSGSTQAALGNFVTWGVVALGVATVLPRLVGLLQGVGVALSILGAHPLVALASGIAALITVTGGWGAALEGIGGILERVGEVAGDVFGRVGGLLESLDNASGNIVSNIARGIGSLLSNLDQQLTGGAIGDFLSGAWSRIRETWQGLTGQGGGGGAGAGGAGPGHMELQQAGGQTSSVQDVFRTFQQAAARTDISQRQLDVLEEIRDRLPGGNSSAPSAPAPPPRPPVVLGA